LSGSETGVTYQLKMGPANIGAPVAGTGSAILFGNFPAGGYNVVASTSVNCTRVMTGSAVITLTAIPQTLNYISTYNCDGSVNLSVNNAIGSVLWTPGNQTTTSILVTVAGVYSAVQTVNGCTSNNAPVTVTPVTSPAVFTVSGGGSYCAPGAGVSVTLSGSETMWSIHYAKMVLLLAVLPEQVLHFRSITCRLREHIQLLRIITACLLHVLLRWQVPQIFL
jgi:hypothetical protein